MTWGIIGAVPEEIALLRAHLTENEAKTIGGASYVQGRLYGQDVVLACSGVGTINAAACAGIVIREYGADAVIKVGLAGAAGEGLGVLDVVLSREVLFHDADMLLTQHYPFTLRFAADSRLMQLARHSCQSVAPQVQCRVGVGATGDQFVSSAEEKAAIIKKTAPDCIEMGAAAIGQVAYMNGVPFVAVCTLSDMADAGSGQQAESPVQLAANQSASIVIEMMKQAPGWDREGENA